MTKAHAAHHDVKSRLRALCKDLGNAIASTDLGVHLPLIGWAPVAAPLARGGLKFDGYLQTYAHVPSFVFLTQKSAHKDIACNSQKVITALNIGCCRWEKTQRLEPSECSTNLVWLIYWCAPSLLQPPPQTDLAEASLPQAFLHKIYRHSRKRHLLSTVYTVDHAASGGPAACDWHPEKCMLIRVSRVTRTRSGTVGSSSCSGSSDWWLTSSSLAALSDKAHGEDGPWTTAVVLIDIQHKGDND